MQQSLLGSVLTGVQEKAHPWQHASAWRRALGGERRGLPFRRGGRQGSSWRVLEMELICLGHGAPHHGEISLGYIVLMGRNSLGSYNHKAPLYQWSADVACRFVECAKLARPKLLKNPRVWTIFKTRGYVKI